MHVEDDFFYKHDSLLPYRDEARTWTGQVFCHGFPEGRKLQLSVAVPFLLGMPSRVASSWPLPQPSGAARSDPHSQAQTEELKFLSQTSIMPG